MKQFILGLLVLLNFTCYANVGSLQISDKYSKTAFPIFQNQKIAHLLVDLSEDSVVQIASRAFCKDLKDITSYSPVIYSTLNANVTMPIIIGTVGKSDLINSICKKKSIPFSSLTGKWENYVIAVVDHPTKGIKRALVVIGSDRRGTAFGVFELSKMMGVSPFVWWADVIPVKKSAIFVEKGVLQSGTPSVKYRGIFLNDEDWGLQPWAAKQMDTDIKDIGPKTYTKIFELLLRLKANFIWPAMHPCTKGFYYYPENPVVADNYAIVVGTSHCEPMLRNNVFEWKENFEQEYGRKSGPWRYDLNKKDIQTYWEDRVKQTVHYESVYTVGMRGIHDGSMPGPKDVPGKIQLMDTVITDQREILSRNFKKDSKLIPQLFCPYKEVLTLYQKGVKLPEDVTLVWADDNHGYIRNLSDSKEQLRSGRSGVYYHLSYWGAPADYLWLSSTSPSLISFEMTKAYDYSADRLWVFNVGDIKPAEMEMEFAMELAWDVKKWTPQNASKFTNNWANRTFGNEFADRISEIKTEYYALAQSGKPEHIGILRFTETKENERIERYRVITQKAEQVYTYIPIGLKSAYFQLILYPVKAAYLQNQKVFYANQSILLAKQKKPKANELAKASRAAYQEIQNLTQYYNTIENGKWNGIMSAKPRNKNVFRLPILPDDTTAIDVQKLETGLLDQENIKGEVVWDIDSLNYNIIPAGDAMIMHGTSSIQCVSVPFLGCKKNSLTSLPLNRASISDFNNENCPYAEYRLAMHTGKKAIVVKCLATHLINKEHQLRYGISVNEDAVQSIDIESKEYSKKWSSNVLRGYASGKTYHIISKEGDAIVRIYLPDPGVVVSSIEVQE